jgi:hypothetical protein
MIKKIAQIFVLSGLAILIFVGVSCLKKKTNKEAAVLPAEETKKLRQSGGKEVAPSLPAQTAVLEQSEVAEKNIFEISLMPGTFKISFDKTDDFEETVYETINSQSEIFEYYKNSLSGFGWKIIFSSGEMLTFEKEGKKIDIVILEQKDEINTFGVIYWFKK